MFTVHSDSAVTLSCSVLTMTGSIIIINPDERLRQNNIIY